MNTLQPTLRLGRDVWDREAMPVEEFHHRVARLRSAMEVERLDALLLYGAGLDECGHPTWVSHYIVKLPFAALVVLPREGEPALLFQGASRGRTAAGDTTWIEDVRPCWDLAGECLRVLAERGLMQSSIGLAGLPRLMPFGDWEALAGGLAGARLVEAEPLIDGLRAIKSAREMAQVRHARQLAHEGLRRATGLRAPTPTETTLAAEVIHEVRRRGAQDVRVSIGRFQDDAWCFAPPDDSEVDLGQRLCLSVAASWDRYWAEAAVTVEAGPAGLTPVAPEEVHARLSAVIEALPGVALSEVVRSAGEVGISGIGVTPEESLGPPGVLDLTIGRGMCLAIRLAFRSGMGQVYGADTLVVS